MSFLFVRRKIPRRWCSGYELDWGGHVETRIWCSGGRWSGALSGWVAGCPSGGIPSAHVQPKHLMKSGNSLRTDYFHKNNALVILPFHSPLILPSFRSSCPSLGTFMWEQEWWFSSTSGPGQVQHEAIWQQVDFASLIMWIIIHSVSGQIVYWLTKPAKSTSWQHKRENWGITLGIVAVSVLFT